MYKRIPQEHRSKFYADMAKRRESENRIFILKRFFTSLAIVLSGVGIVGKTFSAEATKTGLDSETSESIDSRDSKSRKIMEKVESVIIVESPSSSEKINEIADVLDKIAELQDALPKPEKSKLESKILNFEELLFSELYPKDSDDENQDFDFSDRGKQIKKYLEDIFPNFRLTKSNSYNELGGIDETFIIEPKFDEGVDDPDLLGTDGIKIHLQENGTFVVGEPEAFFVELAVDNEHDLVDIIEKLSVVRHLFQLFLNSKDYDPEGYFEAFLKERVSNADQYINMLNPSGKHVKRLDV